MQLYQDWSKKLQKNLISGEESPTRKQTKTTEYWLKKQIRTHNRFNVIGKDSKANKRKGSNDPTIISKLPPVSIYKRQYTEQMHKILKETAAEKYTTQTLGHKNIKFKLLTPEHYLATMIVLRNVN